ncbi:unnamed protein product [Microthlaspi erraticum]|uniref:Uncharacterized protein n=1 Tax=Microthlaspi erraticum TaxID=1685480 RepID=A0A6D2L9D1_9BRAS|nr:unnamed protein product [Microthlaspi erraticum]
MCKSQIDAANLELSSKSWPSPSSRSRGRCCCCRLASSPLPLSRSRRCRHRQVLAVSAVFAFSPLLPSSSSRRCGRRPVLAIAIVTGSIPPLLEGWRVIPHDRSISIYGVRKQPVKLFTKSSSSAVTLPARIILL